MPAINEAEISTILDNLKTAYQKDEFETQLQAFQQLGDSYMEDERHIDAVALYNFALAICLDETKDHTFLIPVAEHQDKIIASIKQAEANFLQTITGKTITPSPVELDQIHRDYLTSLRNEARAKLARHRALTQLLENQLPATDHLEKAQFIERKLSQAGLSIQQVYQSISEQLRQFVKDLIIECKRVLGDPPCGYAIICFGSLARDEATPYSDLEFGILIEDTEAIFRELGTQNYEIDGKSYAYHEAAKLLSEQYKDYFRDLTRLLNIKVINLGETTPRIQNIVDLKEIGLLDRYAESPIRPGFCFDGQMQGACKTPLGNKHLKLEDALSYELICTPRQMSLLSHKEGWHKDKHFPTALSTVALIDGDQALVNKYQDHKKKADIQWVKEKAIHYLSEAADSFSPQIGVYREQNIYVSTKYHLYRLPNMIVVHLAMYFNIQKTNIWDCIDELIEKQELVDNESVKLLKNLKLAASQVTKIRLTSYLEKNYQHNETELPKAVVENKNDEIISIYKILIPFYMNLKSAIYSYSGNNLSLEYEPITKNESFIQGDIYALLLKYEDATNCYKKALEIIVNDEVGKSACHSRLGNVYYQQGKHVDAFNHYFTVYELTKDNTNNILKAKDLNNLAIAYYSLSQYDKAVKYLNEAHGLMADTTSINLRDKAIRLNNIGATYHSVGEFHKAKNALEQSYQLHQEIDPENLSSIVTLRSLSETYMVLGKFNEAEEKCKKGLAIIAKKFGEEHAANIDMYTPLANIYINLNKFSEAQQSIKKGLTIFKSFHGNNRNRNWARLYEHKAEIRHKRCQFDKALKAYTKVQNVLAKEYSNDSNALSHTLGSIALVYSSMGDYKMGGNFIYDALDLYKNKNIKYHYNIGKLNLWLAELKVKELKVKELKLKELKLKELKLKELKLKELKGAPNDRKIKNINKFCEIAEDNFKKAYGDIPFESSSTKASILMLKATLFAKAEKFDDGIKNLKEAKKIFDYVYKNNKHHTEIAEYYNILGSTFENPGKNTVARNSYQKALAIYQVYPNQNHTSIAEIKNNLAQLHSTQGHYLTAIELYNEAYTILKQIYGEANQNHPNIGFLLIAMADVFSEWAEEYPHTEWEKNNLNNISQTEAESCLLQASHLYFKEALNITKANDNKKFVRYIENMLRIIEQKLLKTSTTEEQPTRPLPK